MKIPLTEDQIELLFRERIDYYNDLAPFSAYHHNLYILLPAPYVYKNREGRFVNFYPAAITLFTNLHQHDNGDRKRLELKL